MKLRINKLGNKYCCMYLKESIDKIQWLGYKDIEMWFMILLF